MTGCHEVGRESIAQRSMGVRGAGRDALGRNLLSYTYDRSSFRALGFDGTRHTHTYAPDGLRRRKETAEGLLHHLWDGQNLLRGSDGNLDPVAQYTDFPGYWGGLVSQRRGSDSRFYGFDMQANTRLLADESEAVTDTDAYRAFGEGVDGSGSTPHPHRFDGRDGVQRDEADRDYLRRRHRKPSLGGFVSRDPEWPEDGPNWYLYVGNRVPNRTDPSGLQVPEYGPSDWYYISEAVRQKDLEFAARWNAVPARNECLRIERTKWAGALPPFFRKCRDLYGCLPKAVEWLEALERLPIWVCGEDVDVGNAETAPFYAPMHLFRREWPGWTKRGDVLMLPVSFFTTRAFERARVVTRKGGWVEGPQGRHHVTGEWKEFWRYSPTSVPERCETLLHEALHHRCTPYRTADPWENRPPYMARWASFYRNLCAARQPSQRGVKVVNRFLEWPEEPCRSIWREPEHVFVFPAGDSTCPVSVRDEYRILLVPVTVPGEESGPVVYRRRARSTGFEGKGPEGR